MAGKAADTPVSGVLREYEEELSGMRNRWCFLRDIREHHMDMSTGSLNDLEQKDAERLRDTVSLVRHERALQRAKEKQKRKHEERESLIEHGRKWGQRQANEDHRHEIERLNVQRYIVALSLVFAYAFSIPIADWKLIVLFLCLIR